MDNLTDDNNTLNADISLDNLVVSEGLSIRSYNVLYVAKLFSLNLILEYYKSNLHFLNFRNCGYLSNKELITLCLKYLHFKHLSSNTHASSVNIITTNNDKLIISFN